MAMEVILTRHGEGKLSTKTMFADEGGFCVGSVLVMGQKECVLIDCQFSLSNAHRVIAEILETGLELKAVFSTHAHPDHYWGLGILEQTFPRAKCYMLPYDCDLYNDQYQPKLDEWITTLGEPNLCRKQCENLLPLKDGFIELEGERIEVVERVMGDLKWNSVVWIPSIKTLYGSDVLFNEAHPFTCEVTSAERKQWHDEIVRLEKELQPEVVIPGHQKHGCLLDRSSMKFTKDYLIATEEELAATKDAANFFYNMEKRFPNCAISMLSSEMNAEVLKGSRDWEWRAEEE